MNYVLSAIAIVEFLYIVHLIYERKHYEKALELGALDLHKAVDKHLKYVKETESKINLLEKVLDQRTKLVEELETKLAVYSESVTMGKPPRAKKPHRKPRVSK